MLCLGIASLLYFETIARKLSYPFNYALRAHLQELRKYFGLSFHRIFSLRRNITESAVGATSHDVRVSLIAILLRALAHSVCFSASDSSVIHRGGCTGYRANGTVFFC